MRCTLSFCTDSSAMFCPKSTQLLISMTAVALLVVSGVNGASVAVDSKSEEKVVSSRSPDAAQPDAPKISVPVASKEKLSAEAVVAEEDPSDPRIGLYSQQVENFDSIGPIGANKAFYLTTLDGGYGSSGGSGYQTSYGLQMPDYNHLMRPPPAAHFSYGSYNAYPAPAFQTAPPTAPTPMWTGSLYGASFSNPPPSAYVPSYSVPSYSVPSYTTQPPQTVSSTAPPYPPPTTPQPPSEYTEGYTSPPVTQPTQQPSYNAFTPYTFSAGYGMNTGYGIGYGSMGSASPSASVGHSLYGSASYSPQLAQVPYGSPLAAYTPVQHPPPYGAPVGIVPFGVNRIPEAYVSASMGGYASYGPVNAGPVMAPMGGAPAMSTVNTGYSPMLPNVNLGAGNNGY